MESVRYALTRCQEETHGTASCVTSKYMNHVPESIGGGAEMQGGMMILARNVELRPLQYGPT